MLKALSSAILAGTILLLGDIAVADCARYVVQPIQHLSVTQVGRLAEKQIQSTSEATAILWRFDVEDRSMKNGLSAAAFFLVTTGDIGAKPVGAIIWANSSADASLENDSAKGFKIAIDSSTEGCTPVMVPVRIMRDSSVVVGKTKLGRIQ